MSDRVAKALGLLALVWLAAYWLWVPGVRRSEIEALAAGSVGNAPGDRLRREVPAQSSKGDSAEPSPSRPGAGSAESAGTIAPRPNVEEGPRPGSRDAAPKPIAIHVVRPGETLGGIAKRYYGRASRSGLIFDANRDELEDPDDLALGQRLRIPPLPADD